jgi:hypothetical protein
MRWLAAASFVSGALVSIIASEPGAALEGRGGQTSERSVNASPLNSGALCDGAVESTLNLSLTGPRILVPPGSKLPAVGRRSPARGAHAAQTNIDPEAGDPGLWREHLALLAARPFLQRLPYRDRELGVALQNVNLQGMPVLLVTYLGTLRAAQQDIGSVLARAHDPGNEYKLRFEHVSG